MIKRTIKRVMEDLLLEAMRVPLQVQGGHGGAHGHGLLAGTRTQHVNGPAAAHGGRHVVLPSHVPRTLPAAPGN